MDSVGELSTLCSQIVLKVYIWHVLVDLMFYGLWANLLVRWRWNSGLFRKSHVRTNKFDVQETDPSFTQFYRNWNCFSRFRFTHGWIPDLDLWDSVIEVFHSSPDQQNQRCKRATEKLVAKHELNMRRQIPTPNTNLDLTNFDLVPSSGTHSGSNATLFVFEDKPWLRWLSKAEVPQWDMCQEPQSCFGLVVWQD